MPALSRPSAAQLITGNAGTASWSGPLYPKVKATTGSISFPALFDVEADAGEHTNLAGANAALVANMTARLQTLMATDWAPAKPNVTKEAKCQATLENGGYLTPADWTPTWAARS